MSNETVTYSLETVLKEIKDKENRSPDPAILGRVRTRDPDPGHFGPDFDSGSGHGFAFTDPRTGCLP